MASAKKRERGPVVLTPRDRELLVHLALARHLSADQIGRLAFAGKTDSIVRRRLCRLASGKHPYVGRVPFRTRDGVRIVVWSLRSLGYLAARNLFGEIPNRPVNIPARSSSSEKWASTNCTWASPLPRAAGSFRSIADRSAGSRVTHAIALDGVRRE